jgi:transcriptional regulator with XRE-family HTH domain
MYDDVVLAARLRTLRRLSGLSQADLGKLIGASQREISQYERGKTFPRPERIEAIARVLGVDVGDLFNNRKVAAEPTPGTRAAALVELAHQRDPLLAALMLRVLSAMLADDE